MRSASVIVVASLTLTLCTRALAIATWFKQHGVVVVVYARGFGEDRLKVETPDHTDQEQNRRAEYEVGVDSPTLSLAGWTLVKG